MHIYANVLETNSIIEKNIVKQYLIQLNKKFASKQKNILNQIKVLFRNLLLSSNTMLALSGGGQLAKIFGFRPGEESKVVNIITELVNLFKVEFHPFQYIGNKIVGHLSYYIETADIVYLSLSDEAHIISEKGFKMPWLKSLIIDGDTISFGYDYQVIYKPGWGRSGGAIMVPTNAQPWRVPPTYAGTILDNWFTRIFDSDEFKSGFNSIINGALV